MFTRFMVILSVYTILALLMISLAFARPAFFIIMVLLFVLTSLYLITKQTTDQ